MKTIILAGGLGTRLSEYTDLIPKPMVEIGGLPLVTHVMGCYAKYGYKDFILALGYRADYVKSYFANISMRYSDFRVKIASGAIETFGEIAFDWDVTLVDTGLKSMTGGRIKRLKDFVGGATFMVTYGDGVSNINIDELVRFHKSHGRMATVTAVRPVARFGELIIDTNGKVESFREKPQVDQGWINGGFMVFEPQFLNLIENDSTVLEKSPLETAASLGELMSYRHDGFWQCVDTKRDKDYLEQLLASDTAPWA